jgi:GAF domain-containing protein
MVKDGKLLGVLDIDSPIKNRFDEIDQQYLEEFVKELTSFL